MFSYALLLILNYETVIIMHTLNPFYKLGLYNPNRKLPYVHNSRKSNDVKYSLEWYILNGIALSQLLQNFLLKSKAKIAVVADAY